MAPTTAPPTAPPRPAADGPAQRPQPLVGGRAEWLGGWRVALRLARRDVRRHLGRSVLIVLMVALPVLLLVAGNVLFSTQQLSPTERIPYLMGQAQAHVSLRGDSRAIPLPDPLSYPWLGAGAFQGEPSVAPLPIPGWGPSPAERSAALGALVGGTAYPVVFREGTVTLGRKVIDVRVLGVDPARHPSAQGVARLRSGRWPSSPSECLVSRAGLARGLPEQGQLTVEDQFTGQAGTCTIVGVGDGDQVFSGSPAAVDVIAPPPTTLPAGVSELPFITAYLIDRPTPVTWAEVKRLADYGLAVTSRAVLLDPPPSSEVVLPPGMSDEADRTAEAQAMVAAIMAMGLLLETSLLVGPAFAVSAARQRRTLALAASNGATTAQLRRSVLAQALVLGVLAALIGAGLGVLGARLVVGWSLANHPDVFFGPFDLPWLPVAIITGCAVLSAIVAALIPARGLARLDIVAVMRGQSVSTPARRRTPVAGLALVGVGAVGVFWTFAQTLSSETLLGQLLPFIAMGSFGLVVVGALLLVPMALVGAARLTRSAPAPWRMAMRDAARQRGRATSTVAAILGATALLASILVISASTSAHGERQYQPQLPIGQARVMPRETPSDSARWLGQVRAAVREADPALRVGLTQVVDLSPKSRMAGPAESMPFLVALRTGCTPEQVLSTDPGQRDMPPDTRCVSLRGFGTSDDRGTIRVDDLDELVAAYGLDAAQTAMLRAGGLVVNGDRARTVTFERDPGGGWGTKEQITGQVDLVDGQVTFARGTMRYPDNGPAKLESVSTFRLPATPIPNATLNPGLQSRFGMLVSYGALMTTETAARLGLATAVLDGRIVDPRGALTEEAAGSIAYAVQEQGLGYFYVERGFVPYDALVAAILLGLVGLVILVATLVSTALSTAETQPLMGTFAAIGATRGTRRSLAAAQAASLGVVGALLGVLVGLVPGIAISRSVTGQAYAADGVTRLDPTVVVPWLQLLVPILGVPALAALLAWSSIRRRPTVTRRLT